MQLTMSFVDNDYFTDAVFDEAKVYRYSLIRRWNDKLPRLTYIMLNPSTANENDDDPTIRRCLGFAKQWNYGSIEVVNLFAYRATDPSELLSCTDPIGYENNKYILEAIQRSSLIVLAWGTKGSLKERDKEVVRLLNNVRENVYCLSRTKEGHPKHPLYVRGDTKPIYYFSE
ncbi:DUF1643 domain-containing protein [Brevibacillus sp. HD1.4A]|uniref:DUF1643 domain-containing protein n=1 Tax=Brevibacillus sp. HD1.4A TaxID=2738978 RepID=UPI00352D7DB0